MSTLMHPRVASNYAAMGYYPTDTGTIQGISQLIETSQRKHTCLDPSSGCGRALAALTDRCLFPNASRYGVELDVSRARDASSRLDFVLEGSALDVHVTPGSIDLLFMNPPYGWGLNNTDVHRRSENSGRLEHQFLKRFFGSLAPFGLMVYIIAKQSLGKKILRWLYCHYDEIRIYRAAIDRFEQIVVIGRKRQAVIHQVDEHFLSYWEEVCLQDAWPALPSAPKRLYRLPSTQKTVRLVGRTLEAKNLAEVKTRYKGLWLTFAQTFCRQTDLTTVRPIHDLSDWHTCLLITSGVVNGLIDNGERRLLIKGKTRKIKKVKLVTDDEGEIKREEHRDHFTAVIKAIDLSPDSRRFGRIVLIQ